MMSLTEYSATMKGRARDNMHDKLTLDDFADVVSSVLLNHVLWHHFPQEDHDEV